VEAWRKEEEKVTAETQRRRKGIAREDARGRKKRSILSAALEAQSSDLPLLRVSVSLWFNFVSLSSPRLHVSCSFPFPSLRRGASGNRRGIVLDGPV
jgi:hypothetical protein